MEVGSCLSLRACICCWRAVHHKRPAGKRAAVLAGWPAAEQLGLPLLFAPLMLQAGKVAQYYVRHGGFWVDLVASEWLVDVQSAMACSWLHTYNPHTALACSLGTTLLAQLGLSVSAPALLQRCPSSLSWCSAACPPTPQPTSELAGPEASYHAVAQRAARWYSFEAEIPAWPCSKQLPVSPLAVAREETKCHRSCAGGFTRCACCAWPAWPAC